LITTSTETDAKYDLEYGAGDLPLYPHFAAEFRMLLRWACHPRKTPRRPRTLLDLGGGTGDHSLVFQELGFEPTLFDFSSVGVRRARQRGVREAICGDFFRHDFGGRTFDLVFAKGFSPLATDEPDRLDEVLARIDGLVGPGGLFLYWGATDLSGTWSASNWYNYTAHDVARLFPERLLLPVFRLQSRLPVASAEWVSRALLATPTKLPRELNLVGVRRRSSRA